MFEHSCIKCQEKYQDTDPDPYYCPACKEASLVIAKEVDKKLAGRISRQGKSELQQYDEILKRNGGQFVKIGDLGIKL